MMKYEDPEPVTKEQALLVFQSQDIDRIVHAMLGATFHEPDWEWVQNWCLRFLQSAEPDLRNTAITCLGHLARIHRKIDKMKVVSALRSHLKDPGYEGRIEDALEDIEYFAEAAAP